MKNKCDFSLSLFQLPLHRSPFVIRVSARDLRERNVLEPDEREREREGRWEYRAGYLKYHVRFTRDRPKFLAGCASLARTLARAISACA